MNKYEKALLRARKKIESGKEEFICCALESENLAGSSAILKQIKEELGGFSTLRIFLSEELGVGIFGTTLTDENMRLYRLRYIDEHLIPLVRTWED